MDIAASQDSFYASVPAFGGFARLMDPALYSPLPEDWTVGIADIVQSTAAIAEKRYKAVNMAGAAVIAAVTNALDHREFPFVFGGDGASFAVPPGDLASAREAMAATAAWVRDDLGLVAQKLRSEATGDPVLKGRQMRVPMAIDGHFWVEAQVNGVPIKFLVDSGASVTTISRAAADATGLTVGDRPDQLVRTGNGLVQVHSARADTLTIGPLKRRRILIYVADQDDLNVLGMNVLSTLKRWSVEGRWLILES